MFSRTFFADAVERAVRTFAQGVLGALGAGAVSILDVDWGEAAGIGGLAAVISLLMSVVATGVGDKGTASFVEQGMTLSSKEYRDFKGALESLKTVAQALHTPLDTSELERAARALERRVPKESGPEPKPEPKAEDKDAKDEGKPEPVERKPVGVPKNS